MDIVTLMLYGIALFAGLLGILVFLRNANGKTHKLFLAVSLSCCAWIVTNALFAQAPDAQTAYIIALASYGCAALIATTFYFFAIDLSELKARATGPLVVGAVFFVIGSITPNLLATHVTDHVIYTTPFIFVYALGIAGFFASGIVALIKGRYNARGQRRQQLSAVLAGIAGSVAGGVFFNLILPLQGNYQFVQFGPAFSVLFVMAAAYAIFRHRLFDLRGAIVRVVAYSLALFSVFSLYVITAYSIIVPFFGDWLGANMQLVYPILAMIVALSFEPIKRFFSTITRAVFYKNAYDSGVVLDALGNILVREVDVNRLLKRSLTLLKGAIKPTGIEVIIMKGTEHTHDMLVGRQLKDTKELIAAVSQKNLEVLVADDLAERGGALYKQLADAGVGIVVPLVTPNADLGYLFVGYKASGDAFTSQDVDLVHIFADELAVAAQNALRYEEISHFNSTLKQEVNVATTQLRESNQKLQRLDEVKDEFISMASHQLRTPLTSVKGYLSMVLEGDAGAITKDQRRLLEEAFTSAQRMVYLIGDFLNVSRLQTGKFILEAAPVNLANVVREEVEQLQAAAAMRNITLVYHKPAQFPEIMIDDGKMRQVLMNFIDNAIYYSDPNASVKIELTADSKNATLLVHDTGIGVPASERHRIFTKFFRATNARKVRPDGTGIGLYMAKKVVAAHGGSIIFETKENKGSTFGFTVPLKR